MNCHNNKDDNKEKQHNHKSHRSHMVLMVLFCAISVVLLLMLPILKINNTALKGILPFAIFLFCPLMHLFMMPMMLKKNKKDKEQNVNTTMKIESGREDR